VDTVFVDTAYADTAYADTAYADTAYADTAYADTAFKPTFWEIHAQLATPNRRAALQSSAALGGSRSAPRFPVWNTWTANPVRKASEIAPKSDSVCFRKRATDLPQGSRDT
jgi:hypothetical protein